MFPPSEPCSCATCKGYCLRPGWWTVAEARTAMGNGFAYRMMLEISPEFNLGVLSPAFKGNEGNYAFQLLAGNGCTFLKNGLCELYGTGFQPLECRFCHHSRTGSGKDCHAALENDWRSEEGKQLIRTWSNEFILKRR